MRRYLTILTVLMILSVTGASSGFAQTEEFKMANKFYEDKDYESAIRMYQSILNNGQESANIYFNLGNAYFKAGDLGHAILYYMKARRLAPGDEDVLFNLEFAKQYSRVQMQGVQLNPVRSFFIDLVDTYQLKHLAWLSSIFFILLVIGLTLRYGFSFNNSPVRLLMVVSLLLLVFSGGLTTFKYREDYLTQRAVIIAEESPVFTGASEQSEIELRGAPGLIVKILDESGEFLNVLFENKRRGWIRKEYVALI